MLGQVVFSTTSYHPKKMNIRSFFDFDIPALIHYLFAWQRF